MFGNNNSFGAAPGQNPYYPGGSVPQPSPMSVMDWQDFAIGKWTQIPAYLPTLTLPTGPNIGLMARDRPVSFSFTALASGNNAVQFDIPTNVFAISAACFTNDDSDLPIGRNPLDCFRIQMTRANGDKFQTAPALGSTICGTAANPRLVGPSGWLFNNGSTLQIAIQSLFAHIDVDITFYTVEVRGPFNFGAQALPYGNVG